MCAYGAHSHSNHCNDFFVSFCCFWCNTYFSWEWLLLYSYRFHFHGASYSFIFSLHVALEVRWISYKQYVYELYFLKINAVSLSLFCGGTGLKLYSIHRTIAHDPPSKSSVCWNYTCAVLCLVHYISFAWRVNPLTFKVCIDR